MSTRIFGLFIWYNDDPVTGNVLSLTHITEPRKELRDYNVGDRVKARCGSFGVVPAIIGMISSEDEKKNMEKILKDKLQFSSLIADHVPAIRNEIIEEEEVHPKNHAEERHNNADGQTKQKTKPAKRKLDTDEPSKSLQCDAEDIALANLAATRESTDVEHSTTTPSSTIVAESLGILSQTGLTPTKDSAEVRRLIAENSQLAGRISSLEYSMSVLWHEVETLKSHMYSAPRTGISSPPGAQLIQPAAFSSPNSAFSPPLHSSASSASSPNQEEVHHEQTELENSTVSLDSDPERTYNGFVKSQIWDIVCSHADFKKATAAVFRKIFSEEEIRGRSLSGGKSKDGTRREPLQDKPKLTFLEDIIIQKWPHTQRESIRLVLRDLLKPSRAKMLFK